MLYCVEDPLLNVYVGTCNDIEERNPVGLSALGIRTVGFGSLEGYSVSINFSIDLLLP